MFEYTESLTLAIRHPRTRRAPRRGALGGVHALAAEGPASCARKAWPDYTFGCKRILFSSHFLPALQRANVELVTDAIARDRRPTGIVHRRRRACTSSTASSGRPASRPPTSCSRWRSPAQAASSCTSTGRGGAHAHLGMTRAGLSRTCSSCTGPTRTPRAARSSSTWRRRPPTSARRCEQLRARRAGAIEVRAEVEAASDRALQARFAGTAWTQCDSWYRDENGRIVTNWPGYMREYLAADRARSTQPSTASRRCRSAATVASASGCRGGRRADARLRDRRSRLGRLRARQPALRGSRRCGCCCSRPAAATAR